MWPQDYMYAHNNYFDTLDSFDTWYDQTMPMGNRIVANPCSISSNLMCILETPNMM